jgi:beta-lactamase superfamily II metal-dependent hydrolase
MYMNKVTNFIELSKIMLPTVRKMLCFSLLAVLLTGCTNDEQTSQKYESSHGESINQGESTSQDESTQMMNGKQNSSYSCDSPAPQDTLEVCFLKVGKADAIVLMCGEETMVIDCGEEDDGKEVLAFLGSRDVKEVDVLMITHFDKDHVGGADTLVRGIPVKRVLLPAYTGSGTEYTDFMEAVGRAGVNPENVTENLNLMLGSASILVEPPSSYEIPANVNEYDNDFSLITTVEFGRKRLIFTGDSEKKRIREWLENGAAAECDVLKIPHHGVYNKALADLLSATKPSHTVICDSKKNPADEKTLGLIKSIGADCMQTQYGDVTILCSRDGIEIHQ